MYGDIDTVLRALCMANRHLAAALSFSLGGFVAQDRVAQVVHDECRAALAAIERAEERLNAGMSAEALGMAVGATEITQEKRKEKE